MNKGQNNLYGHKKLIVWQRASELRREVYKTTSRFLYSEKRRKEQMQDAARSVRDNITEGYSRNSLNEYIRFLEISKASLAELKDQINDCIDDGLISKEEHERLVTLSCKTSYLLDRLLYSLREKRKKGGWKKR